MTDPTSPSPYSENKRFEPKVKVELDPPKETPITLEELSKCDGRHTELHQRCACDKIMLLKLRLCDRDESG